MRRHRALFTVLTLAVLIGSLVVAVTAMVQAAETPRRGGVLLAAIAADASQACGGREAWCTGPR